MSLGKRGPDEKQEPIWIEAATLATPASHPFYERLNRLLSKRGFDAFAESVCRTFYAKVGRPGLAPGVYFRALLVGYFEGIDSERGIAWRAADSLAVRAFLGFELCQSTPDHSTISRTRRLIDVETHRKIFLWVLGMLAEEGLLKGNTVAIDGTTLEANAALRSIVRRDTGEKYDDFLKGLAKESGIETPTREQLAKLDRKRKKKGSNEDWKNPHDPDAQITKMKDGRTHLAHKAEHAVDLETGAVLAVTLQPATAGDSNTLHETLTQCGEQIREVAADTDNKAEQLNPEGPVELVLDKGYHSNDVLVIRISPHNRPQCRVRLKSRSVDGDCVSLGHHHRPVYRQPLPRAPSPAYQLRIDKSGRNRDAVQSIIIEPNTIPYYIDHPAWRSFRRDGLAYGRHVNAWVAGCVGSDRSNGGEVETGAGGGPAVPSGFLRI